MALLERYLHAVGHHLPADQEEDIVAELREDIQATFDQRAEELGRELTENEEAELLKRYGRPIVMASRYRTRRHLVGADWFPFYWNTLKIALAVGLVVHVAILVPLAVAGRPVHRAVSALLGFPETALSIFAWVTLVFAVLEWTTSRETFKDNWNPKSLPRATSPRPRPSLFATAFDLVVTAVFTTWWTAIHRSPDLLFLPEVLTLTPAFPGFYLPVLVVLVASMLVKAVVLVRPDWATFRFVAGLATTAAGVVVASLVLAAGPLVLPGAASEGAQALAGMLNSLLRWSISIGVAITIVITAYEAWRFFRFRGPR